MIIVSDGFLSFTSHELMGDAHGFLSDARFVSTAWPLYSPQIKFLVSNAVILARGPAIHGVVRNWFPNLDPRWGLSLRQVSAIYLS